MDGGLSRRKKKQEKEKKGEEDETEKGKEKKGSGEMGEGWSLDDQGPQKRSAAPGRMRWERRCIVLSAMHYILRVLRHT